MLCYKEVTLTHRTLSVTTSSTCPSAIGKVGDENEHEFFVLLDDFFYYGAQETIQQFPDTNHTLQLYDLTCDMPISYTETIHIGENNHSIPPLDWLLVSEPHMQPVQFHVPMYNVSYDYDMYTNDGDEWVLLESHIAYVEDEPKSGHVIIPQPSSVSQLRVIATRHSIIAYLRFAMKM